MSTGTELVMKTIKLTVNLPDVVITELKRMASVNAVTVTEQLRRSIATQLWLESQVAGGNKILVETPSGEMRQLVFGPRL